MDDADYQFTADWLSSHIPIWSQLLDQTKPARFVEIGAYEGRSTCFVVEHCAAERPIEVWCIDTWEGGIEHDPSTMSDVEKRFDHNVAIATARATHPVTIRKIKRPSILGLAALLAQEGGPTMDWIYVDGSHQAPDVLSDAVLGFALLKVGGILVFDDYLWHMEHQLEKDPITMPKTGVDAFMNTFLRKLNIVRDVPLYQLYAQKIAL